MDTATAQAEPAPAPAPAPARKKPLLSLLSIILGGVSLVPFLGIASLFGVVVGVIGYIRERHIMGIIGIVLSIAGIATSPTVWALLLAFWLRGYCMIADCPGKVVQVMENPKVQAKIEKVMASGVTAFSAVNYPPGWERKNFDAKSMSPAPSIFAGTSFFANDYEVIPGSRAVMLYSMENKDSGENIDAFIARFVHDKLRAANPNLQITPMPPVKIHNGSDPHVDTAELRMFSGSRLGNVEVAAFLDGGPKVFFVVVSAPTYDDIKAVWPQFSDVVYNRIHFQVTLPAGKS